MHQRGEMVADSLAKCPDCAKAHDAAANFSYQAEDYKQGIERATRSFALAEGKKDFKTASKALATRAQGYVKLGLASDAYRDSIMALELDGSNRRAFSIAMLTKGLAATSKNIVTPSPKHPDGAGKTAPSSSLPRKTPPTTSASNLKAQTLLKEANGKIRLGDPKAALALLDKAGALDSDDPKIFVARAKAKLALKDGPGAKQDANSALNLAPDIAEGYWLRGQAGELLGEGSGLILQDFKTAAGLDASRFDASYKDALSRLSSTSSALPDGDSAPGASPSVRLMEKAGSAGRRLWVLILLAFLAGLLAWRLVRG